MKNGKWPSIEEVENMRWSDNHTQLHSIGYGFCKAQDSCEDCNDGYSIMEQAMKQKPVSPKVDIDTYVCGVCGTRLERQSMIGVNVVVSEFLDYCPVCGQAVKWE